MEEKSGELIFEYPSTNLVGSSPSLISLGYNCLEITKIDEVLMPDDEHINEVFIRVKRLSNDFHGWNTPDEDFTYAAFRKKFYPLKNKESIEFKENQNLKFALFFKEENNEYQESNESQNIQIKFTIHYNLYNNITR